MTELKKLQELAGLQKTINEAEARKGEISIEGCFDDTNEKELVAEWSELTETIEDCQTKMQEILKDYEDTTIIQSA